MSRQKKWRVGWREWLAGALRRQAARLHPAGTPHQTAMSFTVEPGHGVVVHRDGRGCPLSYIHEDYPRAFADAGQTPLRRASDRPWMVPGLTQERGCGRRGQGAHARCSGGVCRAPRPQVKEPTDG